MAAHRPRRPRAPARRGRAARRGAARRRVRRGAPARSHQHSAQATRRRHRPAGRPHPPRGRPLPGQPLRHEPTRRVPARNPRVRPRPALRLQRRHDRPVRQRPPARRRQRSRPPGFLTEVARTRPAPGAAAQGALLIPDVIADIDMDEAPVPTWLPPPAASPARSARTCSARPRRRRAVRRRSPADGPRAMSAPSRQSSASPRPSRRPHDERHQRRAAPPAAPTCSVRPAGETAQLGLSATGLPAQRAADSRSSS